MTECLWLGFVIVANLMYVTHGQLPITPAGRLSQREMIKNQMRNVFSGRNGYIPILSYLRVRGGKISSVSPAKPTQRFSTSRPVDLVNGRTVDSGIRARNGINRIYMVPNNNRQLRLNGGDIIDERRRLFFPVNTNVDLTGISTTPSGSSKVPADATPQNGQENTANIYTERTILKSVNFLQTNPTQAIGASTTQQISNTTAVALNVPNGVSTGGAVLSVSPHGSITNRSAITSSFGNVSMNSTVEITNKGTKSQLSGNVSANTPSVTHVQGQGALSSVLVQEVEESGDRIGRTGHSTNVYVDDRTGGGNIVFGDDNPFVSAHPGEDVRLLGNGEGYNNNNNGVVPIDDIQTHTLDDNTQQTSTSNRSSLLSSQVILDEANDLNKSNTSNTEIMVEERQTITEQRKNNVLTVLRRTYLNVDRGSATNVQDSTTVNLNTQMNTNESNPTLITSNPLAAKENPSSNYSHNSTNHVNMNNTSGIKGIYGGREVGGDGVNYLLGKGTTSVVVGGVQSESLTSDMKPNIDRETTAYDVINTAEHIPTVRPIEVNTDKQIKAVKTVEVTTNGVGNLHEVNSHNNLQKAKVSVEHNATMENLKVQKPPHRNMFIHVPVKTNNLTQTEQQPIPNVFPAINEELGNVLSKSDSSRVDGTVNTVYKTKVNTAWSRNQVTEPTTTTTMDPQRPGIQFQSTSNVVGNPLTQSQIKRQHIYRFLARPFKPYPWAQARPEIIIRRETPRTQGNSPPGMSETVTQSVFTVRFVDPHAPISQAKPITPQLFSTRRTNSMLISIPIANDQYPTVKRKTQPLHILEIQRTTLPKARVTNPVIVQATPPSDVPDVSAGKYRTLLPVIVQAPPPSLNIVTPDSSAGKRRTFKVGHPYPFSLGPLRIGNVSNKLTALVDRNINAQSSINQSNSKIQNSIANAVSSQRIFFASGTGQQTNAPVITQTSNLRHQPGQIQYSNVNNGVYANLATPSRIVTTNENIVRSDTKDSGPNVNSGLINSAKGTIGTGVNTQTINADINTNSVPISNIGNMNNFPSIHTGPVDTLKRPGTVLNNPPIKNGSMPSSAGPVSSEYAQQTLGADRSVDSRNISTIELPNNNKPSNKTRIIDQRVDPTRIYKYQYLSRPPTFKSRPGNSINASQNSVTLADVNNPAVSPSISNRVAEKPTGLPMRVSLENVTNVQIVQAGPITTALSNTPIVPITALPSVSSNSAIESARKLQNANVSFSVKQPKIQTKHGNLLNSSVDITGTNSGGAFNDTLFHDKGPPVADGVTGRTLDVNPGNLVRQLPSIPPGTPQPPTTAEPLFNSTERLFNFTESLFNSTELLFNFTESLFNSTEPLFNSTVLVEDLDLLNLTFDSSNVTIGLSILDSNGTLMNDSFIENITSTTPTPTTTTTTTLPSTTPFGSMNSICGGHLVGHPDMPPHPTTTTTTTTVAPYVHHNPYSSYYYQYPWHNPAPVDYEAVEQNEALEFYPGHVPVATPPPPTPPIGQCTCTEKAECEGIGITQGLPYEYMCDVSKGLSCCCES